MTSEHPYLVQRAEGSHPALPAYTGSPIDHPERPCPNTII